MTTEQDQTPPTDDRLGTLAVEDVDTALREVADECAAKAVATGKPVAIAVRVQPMLLRPLHPVEPRYVGWRKVSWNVDVKDFEQGQELRRVMALFFTSLRTLGLRKLGEVLRAAQPEEG